MTQETQDFTLYDGFDIICHRHIPDDKIIKKDKQIFVSEKNYKLINRELKLLSTWYGRLYIKIRSLIFKFKKWRKKHKTL